MGLAVGLWSSDVAAQEVNQWERYKGDCEFVLKAPDRYPLNSIQECVMLWEQYKDVAPLSPDERSIFARGPSWLFIYGDKNQKFIAQNALNRLDKPKALVFDPEIGWRDPNLGQSLEDFIEPGGKYLEELDPIHTRKYSRRTMTRANRANTAGYRFYKDKRYLAAIEKFRESLDIYPWHVKAKFNLACNLAIVGDADGALRHLQELRAWEGLEAREAFERARFDKDFERLHDDKRFRRLVGLVRLQILDGTSGGGTEQVNRIYATFRKRLMPISQFGVDRHIRSRPFIYYREGYEAQAEMARLIVANIRTAKKKITWDSPFDLIVVWGDPTAAEKAEVSGPLVQGEPQEEDALSAEDLAGKAEEAKGKAEESSEKLTEETAPPGEGE
ncbi:MAG: hypothetical protein CMH57_13720 [Myxococcales bacterium]|nr:hypothetical protein [Myxococcales bacterium]